MRYAICYKRGSETLGIKGVVNARIEKDVEALARLANSDDSATAGGLRESLTNTPKRGLSPDQLLSLAKELDYRVEISWAACRADGSFDVFFRRRAADQGTASTPVAWPQPDTVAEDLTLHVHDPSLFARRQMLIQQVRDYAKATLPESMVPAEFIIVSGLPVGEQWRDRSYRIATTRPGTRNENGSGPITELTSNSSAPSQPAPPEPFLKLKTRFRCERSMPV